MVTGNCRVSPLQGVEEDEVLMHHDPDVPPVLSTDSSSYGLGAVLLHHTSKGRERPITYASWTLSETEKNKLCPCFGV